jgi:hypothetical protein
MGAHFLQQLRKLPQARRRHMPELQLVHFAYGLIETFQKAKAPFGDAGFHHATVVRLALAGDEAPFFHPVEQAGHIGVVRNHPLSDTAARQPIGFRTAQYAQDVVLRASEAMRLEELLAVLAQLVGGFLQRDKDAVFQGEIRSSRRGSTPAHIKHTTRYNN